MGPVACKGVAAWGSMGAGPRGGGQAVAGAGHGLQPGTPRASGIIALPALAQQAQQQGAHLAAGQPHVRLQHRAQPLVDPDLVLQLLPRALEALLDELALVVDAEQRRLQPLDVDLRGGGSRLAGGPLCWRSAAAVGTAGRDGRGAG